MEIKRIMIVGAGIMGIGIAHVFARKDFDVILQDIGEEEVKKGLENLKKDLDKEINKGNISLKEKESILKRIKATSALEEAKNVDLVIEAASENIKIKKAIFQYLDNICPPSTILASNTSSLSINEMAQSTSREDKVIGMHFFNPVTKMELVEIIRARHTSEETLKIVKGLAERLGKKAVEVKDSPGFIVNRLLIPMINEACYLVMEEAARPEEIDLAMQLGAKHPLGPLALGDLIGLDVCLSIMQTLHQRLQNSKYRPCPLLAEMVKAGKTGRKSGQGFYKYK